jgi:hypothetical protein
VAAPHLRVRFSRSWVLTTGAQNTGGPLAANAPDQRLSEALSEIALREKPSSVVDMSSPRAPAGYGEVKGAIEEGKLAQGVADTASDNVCTTGSQPSVSYIEDTSNLASDNDRSGR